MRVSMSYKWTCTSRLSANTDLSQAQQEQWQWAVVCIVSALIVTPLALLSIALNTDWDLLLADLAFDFSRKTFPMRHAWSAEVFNHVILKRLFTAVALGFLVAVAWDLASPRPWSWLRRFQLRVIALAAIAIPAVISFAKLQSDSHCPWDLTRYGGTEPYVRLFESMPAGVAAGHCMPAGHASGALWMISLAILFVPYRLVYAAGALVFFLLLGFGVGWMQQLRGAHFLSHTLWSMWIALATLVAIVAVMDKWPQRQTQIRNKADSGKGKIHG